MKRASIVGVVASRVITVVLVLVASSACAFAAQPAPATPTTSPTTQQSIANIASVPAPSAPLPPGMTKIFDGKTLGGWRQIPPDSWTVKNEILASLGSARGVIFTAKSYDRYRVIFDVRHVYGKPDHRA